VDKAMPISLVSLEEIPLSSSGVYKKIEAGVFPRPIQIKGRNLWLKDEVAPEALSGSSGSRAEPLPSTMSRCAVTAQYFLLT
jgi:hypothetical protein